MPPAWREAPALLRTAAAPPTTTGAAGFAHAISTRRHRTVLRAAWHSPARLGSDAATPIATLRPATTSARSGGERPALPPVRAGYARPLVPDVPPVPDVVASPPTVLDSAGLERAGAPGPAADARAPILGNRRGGRPATPAAVSRSAPLDTPAEAVSRPLRQTGQGDVAPRLTAPGLDSVDSPVPSEPARATGEPVRVTDRTRPPGAETRDVGTEPAGKRLPSPTTAPAVAVSRSGDPLRNATAAPVAPAPARSTSAPAGQAHPPTPIDRLAAPQPAIEERAGATRSTRPAAPTEMTHQHERSAVETPDTSGKADRSGPPHRLTAASVTGRKSLVAETAVSRSSAGSEPPPETPTSEASSPAPVGQPSATSGRSGAAAPSPTEDEARATHVRVAAHAVPADARPAGRPTSVQRAAAPVLGWPIRSAPVAAGEPTPPAAPWMPGSSLVSSSHPALVVSRATPDAPAVDSLADPPASSWTDTSASQPAAAPATPAGAPPVHELADLIYPRIERRLRMELLLEQERKGWLSDAHGSVEGG